MSGNVKFRWFLLAPIVVALLVVTSPVSWAGALEDAQAKVRQNPNDAKAHFKLGRSYFNLGRYQEAIPYYKEAIRLKPGYGLAHTNLGFIYGKQGRYQEAIPHLKESIRVSPSFSGTYSILAGVYLKQGRCQEAIAPYKEAIRLKPGYAHSYTYLGTCYNELGQYEEAIPYLKESIRINPNDAIPQNNLGVAYFNLGRYQEAIVFQKEALRIKPDDPKAHWGLGTIYKKLGRNEEAVAEYKGSLRYGIGEPFLSIAKRYIEDSASVAKVPETGIPTPPQSGTGSGFFVSKMGHVITNAHVVQNCKKVTIGDNANKQVPAELINTDRSNDLALLKLSTLEMASAESKSLIQKLGITVVPLASKGLLRDEDVRLGEKVLVAGYPFGEFFSNTIKVTTGVVSATRGAGDDSGQFQLDAAVQPGNSGGPIYDSSGNIVGVVISQLDKLKVAKAIGSLPENVNFGIKASTVRQFLTSSGLPSKKSERTEEKSTEQLAQIAKNQALMVMCLQ